jgi:uncharacterized membrane protein
MTSNKKDPGFKTYFLTGLLALLPLLITAFVLIFLWRILHGLVDPVMESLLLMLLPENIVAMLKHWQVPTMLGLLLIFALILVAGIATQKLVGRTFLTTLDVVASRIPVVSFIYDGVRQVTSAFDPQGDMLFRQVVLIRTQQGGPHFLGFVTNQLPKSKAHPKGVSLVYVPTNNLYIGTTYAAEPKDITVLDMSVQQGMRLVVSAGLALPGQDPKEKGSRA